MGSLIPRERDEFFLLREMHHRFGNTLTVLMSLLRNDFPVFASPELQDLLTRYESRVVAFGKLHRCLAVGGTNDWISVPRYVERLCKALSEAILEPFGIRAEVTVDDGELPSERCELMGLLIAELVTNSAKHAFDGRDHGLVRVGLFRTTDSWLCIVSDDGYGTVKNLPGVGLRVIDQLVRTLGGNLRRRSTADGTSVLVTWPIHDGQRGSFARHVGARDRRSTKSR